VGNCDSPVYIIYSPYHAPVEQKTDKQYAKDAKTAAAGKNAAGKI
jgi:hypothetical protein